MLGTIHLGRNGVVSLRGSDLDLIARQPPPNEVMRVMVDGAPSDEFVMAVRAQPLEGILRSVSRSDGIEREVSHRRLRDFPLYVPVGLGTSDLLSGWRSHLYWMRGVLTLFFGALPLITRLELRASQDRQRIKYLYDNALCGYHSADVAGIYRRITETKLRWLGCTREELIGRLCPSDFFTEEGRKLFRNSFPDHLGTGRIEGLEFHLLVATGRGDVWRSSRRSA